MTPDIFVVAAHLEGVPSAFAAARDGIDSLLRDRGLRRSGPAATAESLLRGAQASAALEGSRFDLAEVRAGAGDATTRAAVRLSTHVLGLVPGWQRAPVQALARMHAVAAAPDTDAAQLGRPVSATGAARLQTLSRALVAPTSAPAMVVAAVVHAEIASSSAFASYNRLLARAAERVTLVSRGVDPASVTVPEAGHLAYQAGYAPALEAYASGLPAGATAWLLHAAAAYAAGAEAAADLVR
ncbi:MAG: oxidoreductase [Nocardioidaceae bacterium]|nr:oxidoreductase [Nocardioidaceae bacterium]